MKMIVGNWKMYPKTLAEAKQIFSDIKKGAKKISHAKIVICPPHLYVNQLSVSSKKSRIAIGGQDSANRDEGACTGETSSTALASLGASFVILGHSERREMGESNELISGKLRASVKNKLRVILCVGEKDRDEAGEYFAEISKQLCASLAGFPKGEFARLIVAYEPIWAIGSSAKGVAEPEDFREMSILIRRNLVEYFGKKLGFVIPILYGGSVDDRNAEGFLREGTADGLLIGRVSLDADKFIKIAAIADKVR